MERVQRFRGSGFKGSEVLGSKVQRFWVQRFRFQRFRVLEFRVQRFTTSIRYLMIDNFPFWNDLNYISSLRVFVPSWQNYCRLTRN
jgi:hypothetical protein